MFASPPRTSSVGRVYEIILDLVYIGETSTVGCCPPMLVDCSNSYPEPDAVYKKESHPLLHLAESLLLFH